MLNFAKKIWPYNRSLTGKGNEKTLSEIRKFIGKLKIHSIKSGSKVFDWIIPLEWEIKDAYIQNSNKKKIVDFKKNNLHVMGYSKNIDAIMPLDKLKKNIFYLKKIPQAIPYITNYYEKKWGFCMSFNQFKNLKEGDYKIKIDSKFKKGKLIYGEYYKRGKTKKEMFFSTNICHPSLANNELSGILICSELAKWVKKKNFSFSYRFLFLPETIGALAFIKKNIKNLKANVIGGYNVVCVGDERTFSFLPSRDGNTFSDIFGIKILKENKKKFKRYNWLDRGSDERQYCSPGVDLPIASIMRSKYGEYKEYHNSLDKIGTVVTKKGLDESLKIYKKIIEEFEKNFYQINKNFIPTTLITGEPFLKKRGIKSKVIKGDMVPSKTFSKELYYRSPNKIIVDIFSLCDGKNSVIDIAKKIKIDFDIVLDLINSLKKEKILE